MDVLKIKKMNEKATVPQRATSGSAGIDLHACIDEPIILGGHQTCLVPTGIAIGLPNENYVALVYARSGLAIKHGIGLLNSVGVIDSDYTGEIKVGLINQLDEPYEIKPDERIAQLVVAPVCPLPVQEVDELEETQRGAGGFGSTGR
ncbi:MAG: dUTP diphosphatase [Clostridiales bacterium]|nr:dUTP diphosphatase [Clostridiales bacterium]